MELNKNQCNACGHVTRWHSYKWPNSEDRRIHNRTAGKKCERCGSTDVKNVEDDETMAPYRHVTEVLVGLLGGPGAQSEPVTGSPDGPVRRTTVDVKHIKGMLDSIRANADHAGKGLDGGDSLQALDALTRLIVTASEARARIAEGTTLQRFYEQKLESNS